MLVRFFTAVAVGLLVGGILYEGLLAAHGLFFPEHDLLQSMINGASFSAGKALILTFYWSLGATASALMANGLARNRGAGALSASCWLLPLCLLIGLSEQSMILIAPAFFIAILAGLISFRLSARELKETQS